MSKNWHITGRIKNIVSKGEGRRVFDLYTGIDPYMKQ
jgi:hypothetical protein